MSDRYATARQRTRPLDARRPARPAAAGRARPPPRGRPRSSPAPVLTGAAPGGRLERPLKATLDPIGVERAGAEGKAKALIFDASGIADSTELVELQRFFYPAVGRLRRNGRVVVLGTPPARGGLDPRRDRAAGAGGLHPLARQGGRRPRRDRAARARLRRAARTSSSRPCASCSRRARPTSPARWCGSARASHPLPTSTGSGRWRARSPSSPAPRAGSAPRSPATLARDGAERRRPRRPPGRRGAGRDHRRDRRRRDRARHHRRRRAGADRRALRRRRRRRRPQRRRHQRPDDREDAGGALGAADGDQPLQRGADQRRPARRRAARRQRPHRLRLLDVGDRRQLGPDQLRGLEGRGDRDGRSAGPGAGRARRRRSTPSPPASSRPR